MDLSKGFDSLNIEILLYKLSCYGIPNEWFSSYLNQRHQIVNCNNNLSNENVLSIGVPQGTVLGPILFLIYVNDLSSCVENALVIMYADDTTILCKGKTPLELQVNMESALHFVGTWLNKNRLVVNASKSNVMLVGSRQNVNAFADNVTIHLNDQILQNCTSAKLLGVVIDRHLSFDCHIAYIVQKVAPKIGLIHRLRQILPPKALNIVYLTAIQSSFDYCLTVYGNTSRKNVTILQRLQNRSARAVSGNLCSSTTIVADLK